MEEFIMIHRGELPKVIEVIGNVYEIKEEAIEAAKKFMVDQGRVRDCVDVCKLVCSIEGTTTELYEENK
jgi:hypothetical protein